MTFPTTQDAVDIADAYSAGETERLQALGDADPAPFDVCIYHDPCMDGFTAAWVIHSRWPDIEMIGANYNQAPPDVTGKHVLIVDFSYKRDVLAAMGATAASITVLDHHDSAERELVDWTVGTSIGGLVEPAKLAENAKTYPPGVPLGLPIQAVFDMERSGARLAYDYCFPNEPISLLVRHVEDRDLWRFRFRGTKEITAVLGLLDFDYDTWGLFAANLNTAGRFEEYLKQGSLLLQKFDADLRRTIKETGRTMEIGGYPTPVANVPYYMASEAADILGVGVPFCATYYDTPTGRKFSLRVRDGDFAANRVAEQYGGGGHPKACGFTMPHGWEGDGSMVDNEVVLGLPEKLSRQEAQNVGYRMAYGITPAVEPALKLLRDYMTAGGEIDPADLEKLNAARAALGLELVT